MDTDLVSAAVTAPPTAMSDAGTSKWMTVTHPAGQTTAKNIEDAWYGFLIAGSYGAQCAAASADCVAGLTFVGANGPQEDDITTRMVLEPVAMTSESPSDLSSTISQRLTAESITASSITFEHPYGPAAVVEIQSSDPQTVINSLNAGSVFGDLGLDGYLVQIDDANGDVVFVEQAAIRAGIGGAWAAPYLTVPGRP